MVLRQIGGWGWLWGHLLFYPCNEKSKIKLPLIVTLCYSFNESSDQTQFLKRQKGAYCVIFPAHLNQQMH